MSQVMGNQKRIQYDFDVICNNLTKSDIQQENLKITAIKIQRQIINSGIK